MRAQAQRRSRHASLWSRDERNCGTTAFPEIVEELKRFPEGTTLDGAVVPVLDGLPQPLTQLDERMTRKHVTRAVVEATPAAFVAFDILDDAGVDVRSRPLVERRGRWSGCSKGCRPPRFVCRSVCRDSPGQSWTT